MKNGLRQFLLKSGILLFVWLVALGAAYAQTPTLDSEEMAFLTLINNFRGQNGAGPLQVSVALENSSKWMSNDMAAKNYFSHTDSLGRQPGTRFAAFGYTYFPSGENIAAGYADAQNAFNLWLTACDPDSYGNCTYAHRTNMLYAGYKVIGIAHAYNANSTYHWYWVTDFGGVIDQTGADTLQFSAATYTVNEYAGSATITVTRAGSSSGAVGVSYATSSGTATAGSDYAATSGTLSWSDGDTASRTFTVPIINDSPYEGNETVNLTLSKPTGGAILGSPSTAVLTIIDQPPTVTLQFSAATYTVNEYAGSATITVTRAGSSSGAVGVSYATSSGTATAGSDYAATSGTLSWSDGDTASRTFTVPIINDSPYEGNETVNLTLSKPTGGAILGSPSTAVLTIIDQPPTPSGTSLVFWRNTSTGENTVWRMNGATHTSTATLDPLTGPWRMVGTADFNSDGQADILWRNFSNGANMVWYMNGGTHAGSADLAPVTDQNWKIAGAADFNGDGKPDILWRNISTGENRVWYMNGITQTGSATLATITDQNWRIAGAADFNNDGNPDIVWRSSVTGQNVVWYMEGITRTGTALLDTVTDQNWKMIVGTTDLNRDGKPDILWRNTATGANMVWFMNGITYTVAMPETVTDQNMEIAGQGNYSATPPLPVNGECGTANGGTFAAAPTTNLCSAGTASAVSGTGPWAWTCAGANGGTNASCQANQANLQTWTVTPSVGSNGTISPNTAQTVPNSATTSFTVTPAAGYTAVVGGTCGGSPSSGTAPFTYTTNPIVADCTVVATFTSLPPSGACGSANGGIFTSAPTTNLCSVGTPSAVTGSGPWIWTCQGFLTAQCQANPETWTVSSSVTGGNGTISCTSPVNHGLSAPCTINPNKGYRLATLTDNSGDVTAQAIGNVYTIPAVTTNHVVTASFVTRGAFIFWRNISTGENTVWYMNGSTHTATATLDPLNGAWRMVGTADFNSDGEADILWRNISTGANMVWYMNGSTHTGSADLTPVTDQNWKIVGTADFNSDGKPDILWRNTATGANMVWYMNGSTHAGSADLTPVTDQNWKIAGAADFNNDGNPDIVWRSSVTGQNVVWYMEGITRTGVALLDTVTDQNWKMIVGTTDLNKDGKPDILWRNTATGQNSVWYMNAVNLAQVLSLDTEANLNEEMAGQSNY